LSVVRIYSIFVGCSDLQLGILNLCLVTFRIIRVFWYCLYLLIVQKS
jgi:hypothetical protein